MHNCTECGTQLAPGWQFCGSCGAKVLVTVGTGNGSGSVNGASYSSRSSTLEANVSTAAPKAPTLAPVGQWAGASRSGRTGSSWRLPSTTVLVIAISVGLLLIGGAAKAHLSVRRDLSETRADLALTTDTLDSTATELNDTKVDLESTSSDLADTTEARDQLAREKEILQSRLQGIQGSLDDARDELGLAAGQISTLKTCLNGVAIALRDVLRNNYFGAASALQSVRVPCEEAFSLL